MTKKKEEMLVEQMKELKEQMAILTEAVKGLTATMEGRKRSEKKKEIKWTDDQTDQRKNFATMIKVSAALKDVYKLGMMKKAKRDQVKPRDMFKKLNKGYFERGEVKWEKLQLSWGSVSEVRIKGAERTEEGKVRVRYESTGKSVMEGDYVYVCMVCEETLKSNMMRGKMSEGEGVFDVPKDWKGGKLHIYAFAYSSVDDKFSKTTYWKMEEER